MNQQWMPLWFVIAAAGFGSPVLAGEVVLLGTDVPSSQRVPIDRIDHSAWDALLKRHVDGRGNVDYTAWQRSAASVQALDGYLAHLSAADPSLPVRIEARLAYWINAYNAVTIKGILREYPTSSIRNHTPRLYGYHIWRDLQLRIAGTSVSLEQIEHGVLRKMHEPRIHFAIVCASRSCPRLLDGAYTADRIQDQLNQNARQFFANRANFQHDAARRRFHLSSILSWFAEDFGGSQAEQLRAIAPYLPTEDAREAARANSVSVSYLDYDWSLNDASTARTARGR